MYRIFSKRELIYNQDMSIQFEEFEFLVLETKLIELYINPIDEKNSNI